MRSKYALLPALVALALIGASCGGQPAASTTTSSAGTIAEPLSGTVAVTMTGFAFSPKTFVVKKGTVLEVKNDDSASHSLTADDNSFDTGLFGKGQSKTLTMATVGSFSFHCIAHPGMKGTITVVE